MSSPKADVDALKDLLLWAREHHIRLDAITVGGVSVSAVDHKLGEKLSRSAARNAEPVAHNDAMRRWGGPLLDEMQGVLDGDSGALIEDEDEALPG